MLCCRNLHNVICQSVSNRCHTIAIVSSFMLPGGLLLQGSLLILVRPPLQSLYLLVYSRLCDNILA